MAAEFLHGTETIDVQSQGQVTRIVKSSVIALVGHAPKGVSQALTLCLNEKDDAQFGDTVPGFNIPKTLSIIRKIAGGCPVLVVNVFDATENTVQVTDEAKAVVEGKLKLASAPIGIVTVKNNDNSPATIVLGTDYTIDEFGNFKALTTNVVNGTTFKFSYKKLDETTFTAAQLIGEVDEDNVRTGAKLFDLAYNTYGFTAKILISPTFTGLTGLVSELRSLSVKSRGIVPIDAPLGTTVSGAIAGRGVGGAINFNVSDERVIPLYPHLKTYDKATDSEQNYPYSAFYAAVMVLNDRLNGYWASPSNIEIPGVSASEIPIAASLNDPNSETNQLNAAGIVTVFNSFGTGLRTWGNRNASFPSSNSLKNFINIKRADDVISESMELAALNHVDKPINKVLVDLIREEGNSLMRVLIGRGAVLPGSKVVYNPDDNPPAQIAAGQIIFERIYMIPTPAERITFKSVMDINLLKQLK